MNLPKIVIIIFVFLIISAISNLETAYSSTSDSKSISLNGQILPVSPGTVYWKADFEQGNFYDITNAGIGSGGEVQTEAGTSTIQIIADNVFSGNYAVKATVLSQGGLNHAKALRWEPMRNLYQAYYGAALYIPTDFNVVYPSGWANIMQVHDSNGSNVEAYLAVVGSSSGVMHLSLRSQNPNYVELWRDPNPIPLGSWFTAVFYVNWQQNGQVCLWINNSLVVNATGDFSCKDGYPSGFFDAGIYLGANTPNPLPQSITFDDMICASTLQAATPTQS
jgi:hypothetical protein